MEQRNTISLSILIKHNELNNGLRHAFTNTKAFLVSQIISELFKYQITLEPFSQDYGLASHTTHVVWVNFIREW